MSDKAAYLAFLLAVEIVPNQPASTNHHYESRKSDIPSGYMDRSIIFEFSDKKSQQADYRC
jgi:hypothetical protein